MSPSSGSGRVLHHQNLQLLQRSARLSIVDTFLSEVRTFSSRIRVFLPSVLVLRFLISLEVIAAFLSHCCHGNQ